MSLEPTEEQLRAIAYALQDLCCYPSDAGCTCNYKLTAEQVFALVRDMVLEEAERRLDALETEDEVSFTGKQVISLCNAEDAKQAIRAMKGTP